MLSHTYSNTISENLELPDWGDLNESDLDIELKMNGKFLHNRSIAQSLYCTIHLRYKEAMGSQHGYPTISDP